MMDSQELREASHDWQSAFNEDKNRRFRGNSKRGQCDLIDSDLQRQINRRNKQRLQEAFHKPKI